MTSRKKSERRIVFLGWKEIPISKLKQDPCNPRSDPYRNIDPLANSIDRFGFLDSPIVRPAKDGTDTYWVIGGSRRVAAARLTGIDKILCKVYDMDDEIARSCAYWLNMVFEPLTMEEKKEAIRRSYYETNSLRVTAEEFGVSQEYVRQVVGEEEKKREKERLRRAGIVVEDRRGKGVKERVAEGVNKVIGKTEFEKIYDTVKRVRKAEEVLAKAESAEPQEVVSRELPTAEDVMAAIAAGEGVLWRPKLFKRDEDSPYLHEVLSHGPIQEHIPPIVLQAEPVPPPNPNIPLKYPYLTTTIIAEYAHRNKVIKVELRAIVCPNCYRPLRSVGERGAPVICLECGYPSHEMWKKVGE